MTRYYFHEYMRNIYHYWVVIPIVVFTATVMLFLPTPADAACSSTATTLHIISRDASGQLISGVNFQIFEQKENPDHQPYIGARVTTGTTDAGGQATLCLSTRHFPIAIKSYTLSANYGYLILWQNQLTATDTGYQADLVFSYFDVTFRDAYGSVQINKHFQIFAQQFTTDGKPVSPASQFISTYVLGGNRTTGITGQTRIYLAPGTYVFKIPADAGQYYYLYNQKLGNAQSQSINYPLGAIHLKIENALGDVQPGFKFAVYRQDVNSVRQPILGVPVFKTATANAEGAYDLYLPEGDYVVRGLNPLTKTYYLHWSIKGRERGTATVVWRLSGLRINLLNANHEALPNTEISVGKTGTDAHGSWVMTKPIIKVKTDAEGRADLLLTPGAYSLTYGNNTLHNLIVTEGQFVVLDWPYAYSIRPEGGEMALTTPLTNSNVRITALPSANIRGIAVRKQNVGTPYRVSANTIAEPYTVVFFYNPERLRARGIDPNKLRIAFYNDRTKHWSLVGNNLYRQSRLSATVNDPGSFTLIEIN